MPNSCSLWSMLREALAKASKRRRMMAAAPITDSTTCFFHFPPLRHHRSKMRTDDRNYRIKLDDNHTATKGMKRKGVCSSGSSSPSSSSSERFATRCLYVFSSSDALFFSEPFPEMKFSLFPKSSEKEKDYSSCTSIQCVAVNTREYFCDHCELLVCGFCLVLYHWHGEY